MVKELRTFGMAKMMIGECLDFHSNVKSEIEAATPSVLHLEALYPRYAADVDKLQSVVNRQRGFVATVRLKEADEERDSAFGTISTIVRGYATSPVASHREVALTLLPCLATYKGMQKHKYAKQTREVEGLLIALEKEENAAAIDSLGLTPEVEALRQANAVFIEIVSGKADEMTEKLYQSDIDSRELVASLNAQYQEIVKRVNAFAIVMPTPELEHFIDRVNGFVGIAAASADSPTSGGSSQSEDTPENDTPENDTPDTPPAGGEEGGSENEGGHENEGGTTPPPPAGNDDDDEIIG